MKSRAQIEILGLAVVVLLLLVASVFVVKFVILKEPADHRKGFLTSEYAYNIINTFLDTTSADCSKLAMKELIKDCAQGATFTCQGNRDSCEYVQDTASEIFSNTLDQWRIRYHFSIYDENENQFIELGSGCNFDRKTAIFPLPSTVDVNVRLDIC